MTHLGPKSPTSCRAGAKEGSRRAWLDQNMWGMRESTPGRKSLRAGDRVCFYVSGQGVAATATVTGGATSPLRDDELLTGPSGHTIYRVPLTDVVWLPLPLPIDATIRASLDAFRGKRVDGSWSWLVQTTRKLTPAMAALPPARPDVWNRYAAECAAQVIMSECHWAKAYAVHDPEFEGWHVVVYDAQTCQIAQVFDRPTEYRAWLAD
jgi:hypothetical protein